MQTTSVLFKTLRDSDVRPLRVDLFIDFTKTYTPGMPGTQDWDKYVYTNYSSRIISIEWQREQEEYAGLPTAIGDFVLDNSDGLFTPNGSSPLAPYILPNRPIKIYAGFGSETVQVFVGLTDTIPTVNDKEKTVTFHVNDFFTYLLNKPLDTSILLQNKRTDEVFDALLNTQGVLDAQMSLSKGLNLVPFAYAQKGDLLRDILFKLVEAEGGRLFMSETGMITFRNRQDYVASPVMSLSAYTNIVDSIPLTKDELINVIEIKGKIREVQPLQPFGQLSQAVLVPASGSVELWIDFPEPVTSASDPVYDLTATTSLFSVNANADGTGITSNKITLTSSELFGTSMKLIFANSDTQPLWITNVVIFATPAPIVQDFYIREQDDDSVDINGERILNMENDFFGDTDNAKSKALIILRMLSAVGDVRQLQIKADPSLQLDDSVFVSLNGVSEAMRIIKIVNKITLPGKYVQLITLGKLIDTSNYFTINQSAIGGVDMIAP